ncbi:MAG TPA: sigma 54-interacting transcriptional regulator [Desulfatiglandales bacterium]|nr:sigma 54-interacting transcriptional regulator [Desulfatiglandales bacterium]
MYANAYQSNSLDHEQTLIVASLFKGVFSIDWLMDLVNEKRPSQLLAQLEGAVREGWLIKKDPGYYSFKDLKKQEQCRAFLSQETERQLHRRIADILMSELPDDERKAHALAHHLIHVTNDTERCRHLVKAGDLHLKAFRTEDALQCYSKVLDDLSCLLGEEEDLLFSQTAIKYSKISTARHDTTRVLSILESALERAKRRDMQRLQALLKMHMAKNEWLRSRYRSALQYFEEGWSLTVELNDPKLLLSATTFSTFFLFWQGRFRDAVRMYEKSVPDIEKYPQGGFPLLAVMTVGYCYAQIGQVTQGLGMLDAIRTKCLEKGDLYIASYAGGNIGSILLDIGRMEDSIRFLEASAKEARNAHNDWVWITVKIILAYAYYLKGAKKQSGKYLGEFLQQSRTVQATVHLYPYLMELFLAMKKGEIDRIEGLSFEKYIEGMVKGKNIFLKGVAYRFQAILKEMEGLPFENVAHSLKNSIKWLEQSGHQIELSKSRLALAQRYLAVGEEDRAKELAFIASQDLASLNEALIPGDLRALIKDRPAGENLLKEILKLGQEVVTIRDNKDLVQGIISTVNRITGAERGAIFLFEDHTNPPKLVLRASKTLTSDQIKHPGFASSMEMIQEVARAGKGRILGVNSQKKLAALDREIIRSRICVPMILRGTTVGVLYHDNRLLSSAFKESDLELLSYFAALAAFALDNARAYEEIKRLNQNLSEENLYYKEEHLQNLHFEDIVGESPAIKSVFAQIDQVTETDATVLIIGATGVGKELVARAIHRNSRRRDKPFIRVHCSSLPESLIPSELFGHEKGAFTGAIRRRIGRFELADGGTLFLDEIGDLSLDIQVRLLRVLQTREFERVGGSETLGSDFRLVVATNRDLEKEVKNEKFRADLYYRLAVFPIYVPPLRERNEDIPLLAHYFLKIYSKKRGKTFSGIPDMEMEKLLQYEWPGNVRELENIIERGTILNTSPLFKIPELRTEQHEASAPGGGVTLRDNERRHVLWALQKTGWKVRGTGGAAELLDIPPSTLAFRMKKLGIQRPAKSP